MVALYWKPYVPVARRRSMAQREMRRLQRDGHAIQPIQIEGRTIARSFWGKGWCEHLDTFADYDNRLPRGRTYARNGSVCHLAVERGRVEAIVSGSTLYNVIIDIKALRAASWRAVKKQCAGRIGSLLELLQGKLSDQVMAVVTEPRTGLFPLEGQIEYRCDCPDWADMCKHVAAVMYGIGHRLDSHPELLFLLRGVDAEELVSADLGLPGTGNTTGEDAIADDQLAEIFGIDLDADVDETSQLPQAAPGSVTGAKRGSGTSGGKKKATASTTKARRVARPADTSRKKATRKSGPADGRRTRRPVIRPTGASVRRLRKRLGLSVAQFAAELGVSAATIYRWQTSTGRLKLQRQSLIALDRLHRASRQAPRDG